MESKALTNQRVLYNFSPFDNLITMYLLIALIKYIINHLYLDKNAIVIKQKISPIKIKTLQ